MRLPIPDAVPLPKEVSVPSLSRAQWAVVGGAAVLGVAEVLSPPMALAIAAVPFVDRYLLHGDGDAASRRSGTRRRSGTAQRSTGSGRGGRHSRSTATASRRRASGGNSTSTARRTSTTRRRKATTPSAGAG